METPQPQAPQQPAQSNGQDSHASQLRAPQEGTLGQPNYQPTPTHHEPVSWQAAEYEQHFKGPIWLVGFAIFIIALFGVAYLTGAWTFMALVIVMAVAAGVYAFKPPQTMHYTLSDTSVQINNKSYPFHDFRAFGVVPSGNQNYSVVLIPIKRFGLAVRLAFSQEYGDVIVDILGERLPLQEMHEDPVDKFLRNIHF